MSSVVADAMWLFIPARQRASPGHNDGTLARRETSERQTIMSHFRDIHDDGDLCFSVLENLYNVSHTVIH